MTLMTTRLVSVAMATTLALVATTAQAQEAAATGAPATENPRVFVAKIQAGAGASEGEASILNDALLVAIKKFDDKFEIRTSQDIEGISKLEVAQTLAGCDVVSCAAEIGDALGADQLVTGQLGHVGKTWILSLTRTERSTLKALARTQVRAEGEAPDVLFPLIDAQAAEAFGQEVVPASSPSPTASDVDTDEAGGGGLSLALLGGGGALAGIGALSGVASIIAVAVSYASFDAASNAKTTEEFESALGTSQFGYYAFAGLGAVAIVAGVAGLAVAGSSFVLGE